MGSLALDLAAAIDPVVLSRQAGIEPDPWQASVLRSTAPRLLLNCSRQSGKSTISAALAVWTAVYQPGALILLVSPSLRQSAELFRKCLTVYRTLGRPVPASAETQLQLELENGSRIVSLPGKEGLVRGFSAVSLLLCDEASRIMDEMYYGLRPMLAVSGGRIVLMSTPWGRRGFFFSEWTEGQGWERYEVPASQCPRISPAFLAEEQRTLGPWWYRQEYECVFSDTSDQIFSHEVLQASLSSEVTSLFAER